MNLSQQTARRTKVAPRRRLVIGEVVRVDREASVGQTSFRLSIPCEVVSTTGGVRLRAILAGGEPDLEVKPFTVRRGDVEVDDEPHMVHRLLAYQPGAALSRVCRCGRPPAWVVVGVKGSHRTRLVCGDCPLDAPRSATIESWRGAVEERWF